MTASVRPEPAPPAVELRRVTAGGTELDVAVAGQGPAVLLLHGFPHTWRLWTPVLGELAARHRVIAPDLRDSATARGPPAGKTPAPSRPTPKPCWRRWVSRPPPWWASTSAPRPPSCWPCALAADGPREPAIGSWGEWTAQRPYRPGGLTPPR
jgi:pimeloyl-ACP methyl ester carboxylesterase